MFAVDNRVGLREGVRASPKLEDKLLQPVPLSHKGFEERDFLQLRCVARCRYGCKMRKCHILANLSSMFLTKLARRIYSLKCSLDISYLALLERSKSTAVRLFRFMCKGMALMSVTKILWFEFVISHIMRMCHLKYPIVGSGRL